jgi:hypothetical protein
LLQARYYDGSKGEFLSEDPVFFGDPKSQMLTDPQSLNSYSYAGDSPITRSDPRHDVTAARDELRVEIESRAKRLALYSSILKDILRSDFDEEESYRVFDKHQYLDADKYISRSIDNLEFTLASLSGQTQDRRMQSFSFDPASCTMKESATQKATVSDDSASSLTPIVKERLATAYRRRIFQRYTMPQKSKLTGWQQSVRRAV